MLTVGVSPGARRPGWRPARPALEILNLLTFPFCHLSEASQAHCVKNEGDNFSIFTARVAQLEAMMENNW